MNKSYLAHYSIDSGDGVSLGQSIEGYDVARRAAQAFADDLGDAVYLYPCDAGEDDSDSEEITPHRVNDSETNDVLDGKPSADLIAASDAAGPTGIVSAYLDEDSETWEHVALDRVSDYVRMGHAVRAVYVD